MNKSNVFKFIAVSMSLTAALVGCSAEPADVEPGLRSTSEGLSLRRVLGKTKPQQPKAKHRLVVKFTDDLRARATASGDMRSAVTSAAAQSKASAVSQIAQPFGMRFSQLIQLPEQELEALRTRAALASQEEQPDLAGILVAEVPEADLQAAADALHASPLTEFVYFQELTPPPPQTCTDIAPPTGSFTSLQGYRGPNPGVNMDAAWALGPARGAGIKIADCEYGYKAAHEDLCGVIMEPGQTPAPGVAENGWDLHGTAVLGELIARDNGYGCTGLAPSAQPYFFSEWTVQEGFRRATAIAQAIATVSAGDVVLLEMQTGINGADYGPAELDPAVWLVVKSGTDAGVIVVAAAGNGAQNLDSSFYDEYRSRGDSGAIIVGAGSASTAHQPLGFSTYGNRVNVQGWGESVVTTGYGDLAQLGGDVNQSYTSGFNGTSSASPIVAASVAALQSYAVSSLGRRLTPLEMRNLLIQTGTPQGAGVHIGPLPNVVAAIQQLNTTAIPAAPTNLAATAGNAQASLTWTASAGATSYSVLRGTTTGGPYSTTVATGLTTTSFVNTGLTNGTTYFYVARATNAAGTSGNSNQASATPTGVTIPAAPTNLVATAGNAQASLTWTASSGATSYTVRRSTTSGGPYTTVQSNVTATSFVNTGLTNNTTYFFVVTATNSAGTSGNSNQASARPTAPTIPAAPTNLAATAGNAQVSLTWTASAGATSYNVRRSTTSGSGYVTVASNVTTTSFVNTGLTNGTQYFFVVTATNAAGTSGNSNQASATPTGVTIPAAPTNLAATAGNAQASLTWTASAGATSYNVRRSTTSGSGYVTVASNVTTTSFVNTGLTNGTQYFFVVTATNAAGTSGNSNQASATPTGVTIPAAPTNLAATAGNAQASLTWTASAGATSYNVRRSTTSGSGYVTVASNVTTSFVNTGLTNGTQYFFVVTATNAAGTSGNSNQASATPTGGGGQACTGAVTVTGGQSGNFNTTGAVCYRTSDNIVGWGCSNFDGRSVSVNGTPMTCGQTPLPAKLADGFRYFSISGGSLPWASFFWWM